MERRPTLSINEWAVLGVLVDHPRHGYDIAAELKPGTPIGDAWQLTRQFVYRALTRLDALGMVEAQRTEPGAAGPPRTVYGPTPLGRTTLSTWLDTPVEHMRDVRHAFLLKLLIADHLGVDSRPLVGAQRRAFAEQFDRLSAPPPRHDVVATWRHHATLAVASFLNALDDAGA